ncbi:NADP-dependent isocitrate dehydrogenase [Sulfobacillus harzensis]|uniref:Isocitrate dehydrogenase [NADP] n=1 Tax=Sulfobacillus harzensis TaxID=2729629 RepID=A0A7Y0L4U9_9FIRM|nr:NADP-dependent isocitrate dehydrogenase [Sulfobacillus harzensis]NMP23337.1 NADP-dependent isocitrate dehydrogenase [Sulfobacillus harzensis]
MAKTPITVAYGDGIGPEIMSATLAILEAAGAELDIDVVEIGEQVYKRGVKNGLDPRAWDSLSRTRVFLKAPITTPQGGGYKSLNVTMRTALNLYANVRPTVSYYPYVETKYPQMDVVIVRENEEDLYTGIEHRQTDQVYQCLKLVSRPGSERVIRYAFEYARANGRKKVTCFVKDNIMKLTDGLFHQTFDRIAAGYPDIEHESWIVDIGAAKLATTPEQFDVVVMPNLYGDILSDVTAETSGSVGLAGSANIGDHYAMFEAIHGSAPRIAGMDIANPSGLLLAAVMMLVHIGQGDLATTIHAAWLKTIEDGIHTPDIYRNNGLSKKKVGTRAFAEAVIARLGQKPERLKAVEYQPMPAQIRGQQDADRKEDKRLRGVDVFLDWGPAPAVGLGRAIEAIDAGPLKLEVITNRGIKVYPHGNPETFLTDHWRLRYLARDAETTVAPQDVLALLGKLVDQGYDIVQTESLYDFNGAPGFSAIPG